jgi:glycerol-3-phosphate acyltransferase PlsY
VVQRLRRVDIRQVGSGNVGATNVTRVAGLLPGLAVFVVDLAKGFAAAALLAPVLGLEGVTARLACGLAAVAGHSFPVFLKFQGGKGVATTIGALLGSMPAVAAVYLLVWAACFAIWRYVSVGSVAAAAALPFAQWIAGQPASAVALGGALAALIIVRHRPNLQRLARGTEHRAGKG